MPDDLLILVYFSGCLSEKEAALFSKKNGFLSHVIQSPAELKKKISTLRPDLVLFEHAAFDPEMLEHLEKLPGQTDALLSPLAFVVCESRLDPETADRYGDAGVDDLLYKPLSAALLKRKSARYRKLRNACQEIDAGKRLIDRQKQYLDRFKTELAQAKEELYEEKTGLNTALKEIQQLSRERDRIKEETGLLKKSLADNMQGFFEILCKMIEIRVEKNRGHHERVAHICGFTGKAFGLDERQLEDLRKAAMLHETGKLFIPDETLQKETDALNEYEQDLFLQHPVRGADLLAKCKGFGSAARIIRSYHENSDGTGYPDGLRRRYIPLPSRILAGADLFDSLKDQAGISSLEIFLENLEAFSGSRVDPAVVSQLEKYAVLHMGSDAYRVRGVGVHQLEAGMTLGTAIFTNTGTKLFSVNTLLTPDAVDKIKKYNKAYPVDETVYIRA